MSDLHAPQSIYPTQVLLARFDQYLQTEKSVSDATRECYGRHVRRFLSTFAEAGDQVSIAHLTAPKIRRYVTNLAEIYAPGSVKLMATSIRTFLRYAWSQGLCTRNLSPAVGFVVVHRFGHIPKALNDDELQSLLATPDQTTTTGVRDYAILLLLSRLGLRSSEVASLRIDDFCWRTGTITARTKSGSLLTLPLPADIGVAIVAYLRIRPAADHRRVFARARSEALPLTRCAVSNIVARCATKAGLGTVHAHRLRHTTARTILASGGSLREVGQILGHSSEQVTMIYASFDVHRLRPLARTWPTVGVDHA